MAQNVSSESSLTASNQDEQSPDAAPKSSMFRRMYDGLSHSRQIFCLFCIFDFLFTFFLWIIYAQGIKVSSLDDSLKSEIKDFGMSSSLFDVVLLSIVRVGILLVVYGRYVSEKMYAVAITTFTSTVFLIVKAFVYEFDSGKDESGNRPVDYFLHIGSFILCWAEAWYLQVKVLPREKKAALLKNTPEPPHYGSILPVPLSPARSAATSFLTADPDSGEEEEVVRMNLFYIETARKSTTKAMNFLYAEKLWNHEKQKNDILIESIQDEHLGKVLKVRTFIDARPDIVYPLIFGDVQNQLQWNHSLTQIEIIYRVESTVDICYSVVGELAGGLVRKRDFVNLRHFQRVGSLLLSTSTSITTDLKPPVPGIVRGETPLNCFALSPVEDDPDKSEFAWITTTTFKSGNIPQMFIDRSMPGILIEYMENIKKCSETLKNSGTRM